MGRMKIHMQPINDVKKRRITFLRRKEGLIKKARELSTLCDVNVSMIICSDHQPGPEIFPQDRVKLSDMISAYKTKRVDRKIKSYSLCDFIKDSKNKMEKKRNLEAKFPTSFEFLDNSSYEQLRNFAYELGMKIEQVKTNKMSNVQNLGLQGLFQMPLLNPNPITTMTHFDYNNNNDNTSIMSDSHVESSGSTITNVDNGFYPIMPMGQNGFFGTDQRLMQVLNPSCMKSEVINNCCYDGPNFDLKPEMMQQPQNMDMQRFMLSCFY